MPRLCQDHGQVQAKGTAMTTPRPWPSASQHHGHDHIKSMAKTKPKPWPSPRPDCAQDRDQDHSKATPRPRPPSAPPAPTSTHVALVAVVRRLVLHPSLVGDLLAGADQALTLHLAVLDGLHQAVPATAGTARPHASATAPQRGGRPCPAAVSALAWPRPCPQGGPSPTAPLRSLDHLVEVGVADLDGASDVPGDMDHGHDGLDVLHLVPLIALQCQLVLVG